MLLTIDVGNTHTVLGLFEGEDVIEHWRLATDARRTADEIAVVLQGLLAQSPLLKGADVDGIAICSTVPSVLNEMREMCRRYYGDVTAVIVEPIAGSTGVVLPPAGYLKRLREICDRHGILLIFDEVITGFGRTGSPFAAQEFGVTPDIITCAKGLTNGAVFGRIAGTSAARHST